MRSTQDAPSGPCDPQQNVKFPDRIDTWPECNEEAFNASEGERILAKVRSNIEADVDRDSLTYVSDFLLSTVGEGYVEQTLVEKLVKSVRVSGVASETRHTPYSTAATISKLFGVGLAKAADIANTLSSRHYCVTM